MLIHILIIHNITIFRVGWLRTNGVSTDGAAARVMNFDRLWKKVLPGTFGNTKVGQWGYPKSPSVKAREICSDPIGADPVCHAVSGHSAPGGLAWAHIWRHRPDRLLVRHTPRHTVACTYGRGHSP